MHSTEFDVLTCKNPEGKHDYWFVTSSSNFCHSDYVNLTLLFPLSYSEHWGLQNNSGGDRFTHYREWEWEYYTSGTCCTNLFTQKENGYNLINETMKTLGLPIEEAVPLQTVSYDFFKQKKSDINVVADPSIRDVEFENLINWLGANATDRWSIGFQSYGSGYCLFLKSKSDYEAFKTAFPHVIDLPLHETQKVKEITDTVEVLLGERRSRRQENIKIQNQLNELQNQINELKEKS